MAAKKKRVDDTVGMSKTAKASLAKKGKQEGFIPAAPENLDRVISLAGGEYAYLLDPRDGRTLHLRVGSDHWNSVIASLAGTPHGNAIQQQIEKLGW